MLSKLRIYNNFLNHILSKFTLIVKICFNYPRIQIASSAISKTSLFTY
jgi:hypothetical protein